jgi:hypothetical protein
MRPGRLDTLLYVGIAEEPASKLKVLQVGGRGGERLYDLEPAWGR